MFGRAQQWSGSKAVAFRLLLVVSLWRGPVLWAHEHSAACEDLSRHLSVFHADNPEAWNLGWHWHLCLPESRGPLAPEDKVPFGDPGDSLPALVSAPHSSLTAGLSSPATQTTVSAFLARSDFDSLSSAEAGVKRFGRGPGAGPSTQQLLCRMNC